MCLAQTLCCHYVMLMLYTFIEYPFSNEGIEGRVVLARVLLGYGCLFAMQTSPGCDPEFIMV